MQTKVDHKSFIIPVSNSEIESDVSRQIIDNMKLALKEMSNMGICEIEIMDIIY